MGHAAGQGYLAAEFNRPPQRCLQAQETTPGRGAWARGLKSIPGLQSWGEVQTNIVILEVRALVDSARLVKAWRDEDLRKRRIPKKDSAATHYQISDAHVEAVIDATGRIMGQGF